MACMVGGLTGHELFRSVYGPGLLALHGFGVCFEFNIVFTMLVVYREEELL